MAHVLVAAAKRMALVVRINFVYARSCSDLCSNHLTGFITDLLLVGRILELAIPSVTTTSLGT